jgi:hypothetical protein
MIGLLFVAMLVSFRVGCCANFQIFDALVRFSRGDLFAGDGADAWDNLLPASAHILESHIVLRQHEAGVDNAKARAVCNPGQGEGDDCVQP